MCVGSLRAVSVLHLFQFHRTCVLQLVYWSEDITISSGFSFLGPSVTIGPRHTCFDFIALVQFHGLNGRQLCQKQIRTR